MAANNAAPLQPLPEFHTTVSSVNFECTRALSRKRTPAPIESARPRGRRDEDLGIKLRPPKKDNVSRCSSNTEQSKYRVGFSSSIFPPPLPAAYFRNLWIADVYASTSVWHNLQPFSMRNVSCSVNFDAVLSSRIPFSIRNLALAPLPPKRKDSSRCPLESGTS